MSQVTVKNCRITKNQNGEIIISPVNKEASVVIDGNIFGDDVELIMGDDVSTVSNNVFDGPNP